MRACEIESGHRNSKHASARCAGQITNVCDQKLMVYDSICQPLYWPARQNNKQNKQTKQTNNNKRNELMCYSIRWKLPLYTFRVRVSQLQASGVPESLMLILHDCYTENSQLHIPSLASPLANKVLKISVIGSFSAILTFACICSTFVGILMSLAMLWVSNLKVHVYSMVMLDNDVQWGLKSNRNNNLPKRHVRQYYDKYRYRMCRAPVLEWLIEMV